MTVNESLIRTLGRWAFATLTSIVTTFLGLYGDPFALGQEAPSCNIRDVSAWQMQLAEPTEEATPDYVYRVNSRFISQCPERPEIRDAHRLAARAALDMDKAALAVTHYEHAAPLPTLQAQFAYAAALLAVDDSASAWAVRDEMVAAWTERLSRNRNVTLDQTKLRDGTVYRITFNVIDRDTGFRVAFVAVPAGSGWPATVTLGSDRQLSAFHRLRGGEAAQPLRHIDLYRCTGRRLLARSEAAMSLSDTTLTAETSLTAYLANPDRTYGKDGAITPCLWPQRLLPEPPR